MASAVPRAGSRLAWNRYIGARLAEGAGDRGAEPARRAGDQRRPSVQPEAVNHRHGQRARPASSPDPPALKSGWTLTTPNCRSSSSRFAAIIQRKLIGCARRGDVGVVALRHQDDISFAHDRGQLRVPVVRIHELHAERRAGHVDVEVSLLGERRVLVRWPRGPVAWLAERHARHDPPGLDVLARGGYSTPASSASAARGEMQPRILLHVGEFHELNGIPLLDRRRDLRQVTAVGARLDLERRIARHVERIVRARLDTLRPRSQSRRNP